MKKLRYARYELYQDAVQQRKNQERTLIAETPLTRQQIADMTGLRVETVIRSIKTLEEKSKVKIIKRKVYRKR